MKTDPLQIYCTKVTDSAYPKPPFARNKYNIAFITKMLAQKCNVQQDIYTKNIKEAA